MTTDIELEKARRGAWRRLRIGFDQALARLPEVLQKEGFGIITQIDLQQTFKAKLDVDFRRYRIFGACNPAFALKALQTDPRVGLLLPCNVVLFEQDDGAAVLGVIDPMQQLGGDDEELKTIALTVGERLTRAASALDG